jgi:hypothetical protein
MIADLTAAAQVARAEAKADRNRRLFAEARERLEGTIDTLLDALSEVRETESRHSESACTLLEQISLTYGTLGGTYRDEKKLEEAIKCYDKGNEYEQERRVDCKRADSYNLLQRLVVRLLLNPKCLEDPDFVVTLNAARSVIDDQVEKGRVDSWALADQALVRFMCKCDTTAVESKLETREAENGFYSSTIAVIDALIKEGLGQGTSLGDRLEAFRRQLRIKGKLQ